jgi:uncharacterized membrane protein
VFTVAAMIAFPLASRGGRVRRLLSSVVVGGLSMTTTLATARRWGAPRTAAAATAISVGTTTVEHVGTRHGLPFGRYSYTKALQPQVAGVPVIVPLAWWAMALPAREAAHAALGRRSTPITRVAGGAVALTAWDLFLDPQMVGEGYWWWARRGRYRSIPLSNYAGWLVVSAVVMGVLELAVPPKDDADPMLVAEYATMGVLETVGFAAFFRDRVVAAVGGAAMVPLAAAAVARVLRD